ncbi:MAG: nucleotidyltransferase family protein [Candidatus Beckwithbacteria bacterium]|nr:nucleotidyltransferase family protein [Patescibacteria group bacterium]
MIPTLIKTHQKSLEEIAKANDISYLALFGSHARGEQVKDSDVDFLVDFEKPIDFFELYDIEQNFSNLLGRKIDLVTIKGLSKHIKPYIQNDLKVIYETT